MTKSKKWFGLACLAMVMAQGVQAGQKPGSAWADVQVRLASEGWEQTHPGVFERKLGPTKTEHVAYGREGLKWSLGQLAKRLTVLLTEQDERPSEDVARAIQELTASLERGERELAELRVGNAEEAASLLAAPNCTISYGASADAYPLTSSQGVGAVASAHFSSSCGFTGNTYAEAYARATVGSTTTTVLRQDPKTGTAISSNVSASVNGGSGNGLTCLSSGYAYAQSSGLGISWSSYDSNNQCPAPANVSVAINGTEYEFFTSAGCRTRTWTSSVSGGTSPYSYRWTLNGSQVGTGSSYTGSVCTPTGSRTFNLTVTDANGVVGTDSHSVWVEYCPGGICP
jgi:hypothetical protein